MPVIDLHNMEGKTCGTIDLNEKIFGAPVNVPVMHSVVRAYLLNQRQGTQSTLTRSEVAGGGRKPWRQKGTGRARQGSTRAPQWTKGGIALGPKPRSYRVSVNKKEKRIAMLGALSSKVSSGELIVLDNIALEEFKTKKIVAMLAALGANGKPMIVTTNIPLSVMQKAADLDERRIYDRVLEVCVPIQFNGENFRKGNAAENVKRAAKILNQGT